MEYDIELLRRAAQGGVYIAPERICISGDGLLVDDTDPRAARLLVPKGGELAVAEAEQYGLIAHEQPEGSQAAKKTRRRQSDEG